MNSVMQNIVILLMLVGVGGYIFPNEEQNQNADTRMLLVFAAPSIHDSYYKGYFEQIVDFQIRYAKKAMEHDHVRILVDADSASYYEEEIPESMLIREGMHDIWIRDYATVNPENPLQFVYSDASMSRKLSYKTQQRFSAFLDSYGIQRKKTPYVLDGGNIVGNNNGKIISTTRFLDDNVLEYEPAKQILADLFSAREVAIIEPDDDILAHADGMVAWIDTDVLLVNDYSQIDRDFHAAVLDELFFSFSGTKIITVPVEFDTEGVDTSKGIGSACGVNLNIVATYTTLYVPVFGTRYEEEVLERIREHSTKNVVTIDASVICKFGGSVRCTTWQLAGEPARKILGY